MVSMGVVSKNVVTNLNLHAEMLPGVWKGMSPESVMISHGMSRSEGLSSDSSLCPFFCLLLFSVRRISFKHPNSKIQTPKSKIDPPESQTNKKTETVAEHVCLILIV